MPFNVILFFDILVDVKALFKIVTFLLITLSSHATSLYGGGAFSYGVTTAESDFWNGATGAGPLILLGSKFEKLSLEFQYRKYTMNNLHTSSLGTYNIDINDSIFALGIRYDLSDIVHYNMGLSSQRLSVDYTSSSSASLDSKAIAGTRTSFYVGGGLHGPLFLSGLEWLVDVNYFHESISFGVFAFDFGIIYHFYNF